MFFSFIRRVALMGAWTIMNYTTGVCFCLVSGALLERLCMDALRDGNSWRLFFFF